MVVKNTNRHAAGAGDVALICVDCVAIAVIADHNDYQLNYL